MPAQLVEAGLEVDTLSMGMSADLEAAVAAGATWVRIGTAMFGERPIAKSSVRVNMKQRIAFIGGGNMGRSLIGGLIASGVQAAQIVVADPMPARRRLQSLKAQYDVNRRTTPKPCATPTSWCSP